MHLGLLVICFLTSNAYSQSSYKMRERLDYMFQPLEKDRVPTGFLLDYAIDLVDLTQYDGTTLTDSNYVSLTTYEDILHSLHSACVQTTNPIGDVSSIMEAMETPSNANVATISIVNYDYNCIKANAVKDQLIRYTGSRVIDMYRSGQWQNPYEKRPLFAFTPGKNLFKLGIVTFIIPEELVITNSSTIRKLLFDAGDGNGFRSVPISSKHGITVTYSSVGEKELKLQAITVDGRTLVSHSKILITSTTDSPNKAPSLHDPITKTITYDNQYISARASVYLANGHSKITKPLIYVEGFDPYILQSISDDDFDINDTMQEGFSSGGIIDSLFNLSHCKNIYDLVYVDWGNSLADIRGNAQLLIEIIKEVNSEKHESGSTEKNIVMGHSMGGLVARYALRTMEQNNEPHETTTYVSFDSPHLGANVPLGVLHFIQQVSSFVDIYSTALDIIGWFFGVKISDIMQTVNEVLSAPSVRQMLICSPSENLTHNEWQSTLHTMGLPKGDNGSAIQNLTIALGGIDNGQNLATGNSYMNLNGKVTSGLLYEYIKTYALGLLSGGNMRIILASIMGAGKSQLDAEAYIKPFTSPNSVLSYLNVTYTKKFLWSDPIKVSLFSDTKTAPSTNLYYDSYPCSLYSFRPFDNSVTNDNESDDWFWGSLEYELDMVETIPFIPTASALNMFDGAPQRLAPSVFSRRYYYYPPTPNNQTPFDAYYLERLSKSHTAYSPDIFNWVYDNASIVIDGPDIVGTEGHFTVTGINNPSWSTSDSSIAEIDSNGTLTVKECGVVDVIATSSYNSGKLYSQRKRVAVGFPEMTLRAEFENNVGYKVWTEYQSYDTEMHEIYNELLENGALQYEWSFIDGEGNMRTEVTSENEFTFLPSEDENITAIVRVVDSEGNKGGPKSTTINLKAPFDVNYRYVVVDSYQNTYFVKSDDTYELGTPTEPFMVMFRYLALNPQDASLTMQLKETYLKGNSCYLAYPQFKGYAYWTGTKLALQDKWTFTFFNTSNFLNLLNNALNNAEGEERTISVFPMIICNTEKEQLQSVPFAIIYKPTFAGE